MLSVLLVLQMRDINAAVHARRFLVRYSSYHHPGAGIS